MMFKFLVSIAAVASVVAASLVGTTPASATSRSLDPVVAQQQLAGIDVEAALAELRAAGLVKSERAEADGVHSTITLGDGASFDFVTSRDSARLGGGHDSGGYYVLFNQFDQNMLYNGTGFLLGAAICAIPGVGQLACLAVQAIIAVAAAAVSAQKGTCKNNKQLKVYFSNNHAAKSGCV